MSEDAAVRVRETVDALYRTESRRVLATLIRVLGDFDLAEEALHEAFAAAVEQWARDGVPANPRAWLVSAGRFKIIDALRRRARFDASLNEITERLYAGSNGAPERDSDVEDDRLRLIFTCCHPALPPDAQVAMTLREVCGLTTEEIAHAFLTGAPTVAQRIVRAKSKIRDAKIPYAVPEREELGDRLDAVLHVVYLVFNEGYYASSGTSLTRADLSSEAIRLGRLLVELLPEPEAMGLLALMLLHESRRAARTTADGKVILLDDQNRTLWNHELIAEGSALVQRALASRRFGPYTIQAAIAAVHAEAASATATDWAQIVGLYDVLMRADPSPVVELNRAVAVAMRDGPAAGLMLIDALFARGELAHYPLAHSARADLCRRLGRSADAAASYRKALELARQEPERRFIQWRLAELSGPAHRALGARVIPNIRTQRLVLVAATLEHIVTELKDPGRLGPLLGARVTEGWPPGEYDRAAMMSFRSRLREDPPRYAGWLSWYVMTAEAAGTLPTLVAAAGFMGPPEDGAVEIGYSVVPEARGLGYATEIVEALTRRAFEVEAVHCVVAETDASNASSRHVLERNGFVRVGAGRETTSVRYEKARP